jgi:hypothetical protein
VSWIHFQIVRAFSTAVGSSGCNQTGERILVPRCRELSRVAAIPGRRCVLGNWWRRGPNLGMRRPNQYAMWINLRTMEFAAFDELLSAQSIKKAATRLPVGRHGGTGSAIPGRALIAASERSERRFQ